MQDFSTTGLQSAASSNLTNAPEPDSDLADNQNDNSVTHSGVLNCAPVDNPSSVLEEENQTPGESGESDEINHQFSVNGKFDFGSLNYSRVLNLDEI